MSLSLEQIEERAEKALTYLAETDEQAAELKFLALKSEHSYKAAVDARFLVLEGPIETRKAQARVAAEGAYLCYLEAQRAFDAVKIRREHELAVLEWMRTSSANRRQGE